MKYDIAVFQIASDISDPEDISNQRGTPTKHTQTASICTIKEVDWLNSTLLDCHAVDSVVLLVVERSHGTFVCLISRIVTLSTVLLVDEVTSNFLQSLLVLDLLEAHGRLSLWIHSV